jgi:integrase
VGSAPARSLPLSSIGAEAFSSAGSQKPGSAFPTKGPHCMRHAYAAFHLLKKGIGDILGHRIAESKTHRKSGWAQAHCVLPA